MRILFVWSSAEFSTWDVARGYRAALERQGKHEIRDYKLYARMKYHVDALGPERSQNVNLVCRVASENIVVEAMKHRAELVFIISGMGLHPDAIWLLKQASIPTIVLFTESPYNDEQQQEFAAVYPEMKCFTNERISAQKYGWRYVPHSFDPEIHKPLKKKVQYDVLMIGTFWRERIALLEKINWKGINLKLMGTWVAPPLPENSPLFQHYEEVCVHNKDVPPYYAAASICLNPHRAHPTAESLNPRAYELAACGAFQLTEGRKELYDVFGEPGNCKVQTFTSPEHLEHQIHYWLDHTTERRALARAARKRVQSCTFDKRLETILN